MLRQSRLVAVSLLCLCLVAAAPPFLLLHRSAKALLPASPPEALRSGDGDDNRDAPSGEERGGEERRAVARAASVDILSHAWEDTADTKRQEKEGEERERDDNADKGKEGRAREVVKILRSASYDEKVAAVGRPPTREPPGAHQAELHARAQAILSQRKEADYSVFDKRPPARVMVMVLSSGSSEEAKARREGIMSTWYEEGVYMVTREELPQGMQRLRLPSEAEDVTIETLPIKVNAMWAEAYKKHLADYDWFMKVRWRDALERIAARP